MACVGVFLITVYAQLNDLNVSAACNHLSCQQLISYSPRNGGRAVFKFSLQVAPAVIYIRGGVWG